MGEYQVPFGYGEAELIEKRSRFIGRVWPVESEQEALAKIQAMRERHWDATHNVYCYILQNGGLMRYSDDGEPQGTAGMPTLNVFRSEELQNVCCVVTRYFGGTLLGAGGLVRAYAKAAKMALDAAGIALMRRWEQMLLACQYSQFERMKKEIALCGGILEKAEYGTDVTLHCLIPEERSEMFAKRVADVSAGTAELLPVGETWCPVRVR